MEVFLYIYIYISENICYLFSSINLYEVIGHINYEKLKPINSFDDSKTIRNMDVILKNAPYTEYKKISENEITFNMPVQVASEEGEIIEVNRIYTATFENNGMLLKLKAFDKNNPNILVFDEEYEEVDLKTV